jgi:Zn-dependent membrane protease YugP
MEKDWKKVYFSNHLYQVEIARELLENNGIKSVILNQKDSVYKTFGDVELYVHENDEQSALELLKELKH